MPVNDRGFGQVTRASSRDPLWAIIASTVIASVLLVYPLPYFMAEWRPLFFVLTMLFWVLCQPVWCGVWFAFFLGVASDFLLDGMLGQHALSFVLVAFLARYFTRNQRILTFINLWIIVTAAIFVHLLIQLLFQKMAGVQFSATRHWQPMISSVVAWPVVYLLLKRWRT